MCFVFLWTLCYSRLQMKWAMTLPHDRRYPLNTIWISFGLWEDVLVLFSSFIQPHISRKVPQYQHGPALGSVLLKRRFSGYCCLFEGQTHPQLDHYYSRVRVEPHYANRYRWVSIDNCLPVQRQTRFLSCCSHSWAKRHQMSISGPLGQDTNTRLVPQTFGYHIWEEQQQHVWVTAA